MDALTTMLIDFQITLVAALLDITGVGVILIGFGTVASGVSPVFGYRLKRLGLQVLGGCLVILIAHSLMLEFYSADVPLGVLVAIYALVSLLLLQALLNLLFGPDVGNRVIGTLLSSFILSLFGLLISPFGLLRSLFRSR